MCKKYKELTEVFIHSQFLCGKRSSTVLMRCDRKWLHDIRGFKEKGVQNQYKEA